MHRLSNDPRFTLEFDYQEDFIPNPCKVTILDDSVTLQEVAEKMYQVAAHAVLHDGVYIVGSAEDKDKHRRK